MKLGSLFTGGCAGFDLAAEWAGIETAWQVEISENAHKYLNKNFPNVPKFKDIHEVGKHNLTSVDIICGGFPCQPFSNSGQRKGATDDRYLWPQMRRVIQELQPTWVIGENVAGITSMAFPPLQTGMETQTLIAEKEIYLHMEGNGILLHIIEELEKDGYEVQPLTIPASGIGANHRRDRVWILAHRNSNRRNGSVCGKFEKGHERSERRKPQHKSERSGVSGNVANHNGKRPQKQDFATEPSGAERFNRKEVLECWNEWPSEPAVLPMDDGLPEGMDGAIHHLGNAVVPQIPYVIFEYIKQIENQSN